MFIFINIVTKHYTILWCVFVFIVAVRKSNVNGKIMVLWFSYGKFCVRIQLQLSCFCFISLYTSFIVLSANVFSIKSPQKATQKCVLYVQNVLEGQPAQDPVGRPKMHRSALSQATGEAVYCDDLPHTDGELFLTIVTSSRPHAKIT